MEWILAFPHVLFPARYGAIDEAGIPLLSALIHGGGGTCVDSENETLSPLPPQPA